MSTNINKVKILDDEYSISLSSDGTLGGFAFCDDENPSSWEDVDIISTSSDTAYHIFSKLTTMVKNFRFLYNTIINNKADKQHTHTTSDITGKVSINNIPTSSILLDSKYYIPTSGLIWSLNKTLQDYSSYTQVGSDFTTNVTCGALQVGTTISGTENVRSYIKKMITIPEPSTEYEDKCILSITYESSFQDIATVINQFFSDHTYMDGWNGLKIGNYIKVLFDEIEATRMIIAGFNCDKDISGNGYGILFLVLDYIEIANKTWADNNAITSLKDSNITSDTYEELSSMIPHVLQRNIRLGSEQNGTLDDITGITSNTTYKVSYYTPCSFAELGLAEPGQHRNDYDENENCYKIPLFNHISATSLASDDLLLWTRNVYGMKDGNFYAGLVTPNGINRGIVTQEHFLMYTVYMR